MAMTVSYNITLTIINLITNGTSRFNKDFNVKINVSNDVLYNNHHILQQNIPMYDMFLDEINAYLAANNIRRESIEIDEFEISSLTDRVNVYFEGENESQATLEPTIKAYVWPKNDPLQQPVLKGVAYDSETIIWTWPEDEAFAHYLMAMPADPLNEEEGAKYIIAQLPIGVHSYTETGLEPDTAYTRCLVNYTEEQTSVPSNSTTVRTEVASSVVPLEKYEVQKEYDFTSDNKEREYMDDRLKAFHPGVGSYYDLKVFKQMDADFYQKFKAYIKLSGRRFQRERRYDQVGFNYKICLEATADIEEQEGEVSFDVCAYPREWVAIQDYMYAKADLDFKFKVYCTAAFRQKQDQEAKVKIKHKDEYTEEVETEGFPAPLYITFSLDVSGSLSPIEIAQEKNAILGFLFGTDISGNEINKGKNSIYEKIKDKQELDAFVDFYAFAADGKTFNASGGAGHAVYNLKTQKSEILSAVNKFGVGTAGVNGEWTNWHAGVQGLWECINSTPSNAQWIGVFITDGVPNTWSREGESTPAGRLYDVAGGKQVDGSYAKISYTEETYNAITNTLNNIKSHSNFLGLFAILTSDQFDLSWTEQTRVRNPSGSWGAYTDFAECLTYLKNMPKNKGIGQCYGGSFKDLNKHLKTIFQKLNNTESHEETIQEDIIERITIEYDIDNLKWAPVETELLDIHIPWQEMDDVQYDWNEKRCVDTYWKYNKEQSIYSALSQAIEEKANELSSGEEFEWEPLRWNTPSGTNSSLLNQNWYIIKNVYIKDTFMVGTEDPLKNLNFNELSDGRRGSFDVYDSLSHLETSDLGDDVYCLDDDAKVKITGRTDAVIYDHTDIRIQELNAWDYPNQILCDLEVDRAGGYNNRLHNRRVPKVAFTNGSPITHCITVQVRDTDTWLTDYQDLKNEGDFCIITRDKDHGNNRYVSGGNNGNMHVDYKGYTYFNFSVNLEGHQSIYFRSPILNYRFNLEDPDARTPLMELFNKTYYKDNYNTTYVHPKKIPENTPCNYESKFLHVVVLHVYYAKNVYISDPNFHVTCFPADKIDHSLEEQTNAQFMKGTKSSNDYPAANTGHGSSKFTHEIQASDLKEGITLWNKKGWETSSWNNNKLRYKTDDDTGWWIDSYIWFMAKPMIKTIDWYDELPGEGMNTFYGRVNGRYADIYSSGKKNLRVDTPQFNIPTYVRSNTIEIYIKIKEYNPSNAIVWYKWDTPLSYTDSITRRNGDYVTFGSDTLTYKDVPYTDVLQTFNYENLELFDNKTKEIPFQLTKPVTLYDYENWYIDMETDNSDVLVMRYPKEITFDGNNADIVAAFKGVVNATSMWSPRIHNGYYYLNQHEYYAYSEFDVQANFDVISEEVFKTKAGYLSVTVYLRHIAGQPVSMSVTKQTRAELLQNELRFQWINQKDNQGNWGLTLIPVIDGEFYKEYQSFIWESPILMFDYEASVPGPIKLQYVIDDGTNYLPLEYRAYDLENGKWFDWEPIANNAAPSKISSAYQLRCTLVPSMQHLDYIYKDYLCCYLDWKDDMSPENTINIVTVNDHMESGVYDNIGADGIYVSRIIDYGCTSTYYLDMYESHYKKNIKLSIVASDDQNDVLIENIIWKDCLAGTGYTGRFMRYRIEIPSGEKLYWLHKVIHTKKTEVQLPYIQKLSMTATYNPQDVVDSFQNIESFEIPMDAEPHTIVKKLTTIIDADITERGYTRNEVEKVELQSTTDGIVLQYDSALNGNYPGSSLEKPIKAKSLTKEYENKITKTPFIFVEIDSRTGHEYIDIQGTPQQFSPITVEDENKKPLKQLNSMLNWDEEPLQHSYTLTEKTKFIALPTNDREDETVKITVNGTKITDYELKNHLLIFNSELMENDIVNVYYHIPNTFYAEINREENTTRIWIYVDKFHIKNTYNKFKVFFETNKRNNKFIANELSLNPIYRTEYKGFIYLTDTHNEPYKINIFCNPKRLSKGALDKVDLIVEVLDVLDNPVISKEVLIDCEYGMIEKSEEEQKLITDNNGVVHVLYVSSYGESTDTITAKTTNDNNEEISETIVIENV